ncbi:hypothetical protein CPB86DRAFT_809633 [Serendipita vermifera]|nr:hypothetical protein CPB86DRAFT_809633 [Serendipita vermifera]
MQAMQNGYSYALALTADLPEPVNALSTMATLHAPHAFVSAGNGEEMLFLSNLSTPLLVTNTDVFPADPRSEFDRLEGKIEDVKGRPPATAASDSNATMGLAVSENGNPMSDGLCVLSSSLSSLDLMVKESNHEASFVRTEAGRNSTCSSIFAEPGHDPWAISTKPTKGDFVSVFLHRFAQRPLPSGVNIPVTGLEGWLHRIRLILEEPHCEDAKCLLKESPSAVLFAQQLHLVRACGLFIEEMAQRAVNKDYHWDFLFRMYGDEKARMWLLGRDGTIDPRRRRHAERGSDLMRKQVLVSEAYKTHNVLVAQQAAL